MEILLSVEENTTGQSHKAKNFTDHESLLGSTWYNFTNRVYLNRILLVEFYNKKILLKKILVIWLPIRIFIKIYKTILTGKFF